MSGIKKVTHFKGKSHSTQCKSKLKLLKNRILENLSITLKMLVLVLLQRVSEFVFTDGLEVEAPHFRALPKESVKSLCNT